MAATATAPPPQQAQGQPQQQQQDDARLIALLVAAFVTYHTAGAILAALRAPFKAAGISVKALQAAIGLVLSTPLPQMKGTGPAARWAERTNQIRRAAFAVSAARRIQSAVDQARAQNEPILDAVRAAVATEQRYLKQHWEASDARASAASAVDGMAQRHGPLLSWNAIKDKRCTPGCLKADGSNFRADRPPIVEGQPAYPGAVHGGTCRCSAGPPRRGAKMLPSS